MNKSEPLLEYAQTRDLKRLPHTTLVRLIRGLVRIIRDQQDEFTQLTADLNLQLDPEWRSPNVRTK